MTPIKKLQPTFPNKIVPNSKSKLIVATSDKLQVIEKDSIRFLKSFSNYCEVYFNDKRLVCSKTLKTMASKLARPDFVRVHQSYVINLTFIASISPSYTSVSLEDGTVIPISKANKQLFKSKLRHYYD